jgi:hypothetical protein
MRRPLRLFVALFVAGALVVGSGVGDASILPVKRYKIASTTYYFGNVPQLVGYIPGLPRSVSTVLGALKLCPGVGVHAYVASSLRRAGIVAWFPTSLSACLEVSGGGPGGPGGVQPCLLHFQTAPLRDSTNVVRTYDAVVAGTDAQTCVELSTQVPGGGAVTTRVPANGFAAGSRMVVKCQRYTRYGWDDYVAPPSAVPASRPAFWIYDYWVTPHARWNGVPLC